MTKELWLTEMWERKSKYDYIGKIKIYYTIIITKPISTHGQSDRQKAKSKKWETKDVATNTLMGMLQISNGNNKQQANS